MLTKSFCTNLCCHLTNVLAISIVVLALFKYSKSDSDYEVDQFYGGEKETNGFQRMNTLNNVSNFTKKDKESQITDRNDYTVDDVTPSDDIFNNENKQMISNIPTLVPTIIPDYLRQTIDNIPTTLQINSKDEMLNDFSDNTNGLLNTIQSTRINPGNTIPYTVTSNVEYQNDENEGNNHLQDLSNKTNNHYSDDQNSQTPNINEYRGTYFNADSLLVTAGENDGTRIENFKSVGDIFNRMKTTPNTMKTTQGPTIFRNKQGKQMNISNKKLPSHEQLRNYIENEHIRKPLAVIVDPSPDSLQKIKTLWSEALGSNSALKIVLVTLNASGIPTAYSFNNTRQFLAGLNSIKESPGSNAILCKALAHAAKLVPYDSAVFISTSYIPAFTDLHLVGDDVNSLLKKRIRLYLIWCGDKSLKENDSQKIVGGILGKIAVRSGGKVVHILGKDSANELDENSLTLVSDVYQGAQEIEIPVYTTISSLHIKIDSAMRVATLDTPNGG